MKIRSPFLFSIILSFVISSLLVITIFVFSKKGLGEFIPLLILFVFTCVISFFSIYLFVRLFLFKKLKNLLEKIHGLSENPAKNLPEPSELFDRLTAGVSLLEKERKEEMEQVNRLETHRREYLGNVSHELKTPVFNIQGYIHTLLDGGLNDPSVNKNYLERAENNVDRMINIIKDLETISQLESGELKLEWEEFDLGLLVQDVVENEKLRAHAKGMTLVFDNGKQDDLPDSSSARRQHSIFVYADKFRIRQVLTNLIDNSIKYGKQNGETRLKISDAGEKVFVEIADNGIGIASEHLPRIFERFYRVDKGRSREQGGTGLGLSIIKHILEAHKEQIQVMSTEGAGSVFTFSLEKERNKS